MSTLGWSQIFSDKHMHKQMNRQKTGFIYGAMPEKGATKGLIIPTVAANVEGRTDGHMHEQKKNGSLCWTMPEVGVM